MQTSIFLTEQRDQNCSLPVTYTAIIKQNNVVTSPSSIAFSANDFFFRISPSLASSASIYSVAVDAEIAQIDSQTGQNMKATFTFNVEFTGAATP